MEQNPLVEFLGKTPTPTASSNNGANPDELGQQRKADRVLRTVTM